MILCKHKEFLTIEAKSNARWSSNYRELSLLTGRVNGIAATPFLSSLLKQAVERTSHGAELNSAPVSSPIGKDNDRFILESVERCDRIILAWGNHGAWRKQDLLLLSY